MPQHEGGMWLQVESMQQPPARTTSGGAPLAFLCVAVVLLLLFSGISGVLEFSGSSCMERLQSRPSGGSQRPARGPPSPMHSAPSSARTSPMGCDKEAGSPTVARSPSAPANLDRLVSIPVML